MEKTLVAYFSCTGNTQKAAAALAGAIGADLFEIAPERKYTAADLDWTDSGSRSSLEMKDPYSRPLIRGRVADMDKYGVVFVGFPIWWYVAPHIVDTFLESYDFSGKTVVLFATSGGSGMGKTEAVLKKCCAPAVWGRGRIVNGMSGEQLAAWAEEAVKG